MLRKDKVVRIKQIELGLVVVTAKVLNNLKASELEVGRAHQRRVKAQFGRA